MGVVDAAEGGDGWVATQLAVGMVVVTVVGDAGDFEAGDLAVCGTCESTSISTAIGVVRRDEWYLRVGSRSNCTMSPMPSPSSNGSDVRALPVMVVIMLLSNVVSANRAVCAAAVRGVACCCCCDCCSSSCCCG